MPVWNKPNKKQFQHFNADRNHPRPHGHSHYSHSSPVEEGEISSPANAAASTANPGPASSSAPLNSSHGHSHAHAHAHVHGHKPHGALHSRPLHSSRSGPLNFRPNVGGGSTNLTGSAGGLTSSLNGNASSVGGNGNGIGNASLKTSGGMNGNINSGTGTGLGVGMGMGIGGVGNDPEEGEISAGPPSSSLPNRSISNTNMNTNASSNPMINRNASATIGNNANPHGTSGPGSLPNPNSGLNPGGAGMHAHSNSSNSLGGMNRSASSSFHNSRRSSWQGNNNSAYSNNNNNNNTSPKPKPPFKPKAKPVLGSYASLSETAEKRSSDGHLKPDTHTSSSIGAHINIPNWEPPARNRSFQGRNSHYGDSSNQSHPHHNSSFNERKRANRPWENNEPHPHNHHKRSHNGMPLKSPNHKTSWRDNHNHNHRDRDHHNRDRDRDRDRRDGSTKPWEKPGRFEHSYNKRNMSWRRGSSDNLSGVGNATGGGAGGAVLNGPNGAGAGGPAGALNGPSGGGVSGGNYYGPNLGKRSNANMEGDSHGHYGSGGGGAAAAGGLANANGGSIGLNKDRENVIGVGKYGPGPRFQPPPHVLKDKSPFGKSEDVGKFSNLGAGAGPRSEEDRDHSTNNQGSVPPPRFQSPNKLRLDGSLSTGRNQSHSSPYGSPTRKHPIETKWKPSNNSANIGLANRFEAPPEKTFVRTPSFIPPKREENPSREEGQIDWVPAKNVESSVKRVPVESTLSTPVKPVVEKVVVPATVTTSVPVNATATATAEPPVPQTPAVLMCSALRVPDAAQKAVKVINLLIELVSDASSEGEDATKSANSVPLPDADLCTKGVQELQQQMKQGQQQMKLIKFKMRQAVAKDIQRKKEKEALDAKHEEERKLKAAELQKSKDEDIKADAKDALEKLEVGKKVAKERIKEQIATVKTSLVDLEDKILKRKKENEAANVISAEKEVLKKYDTIINSAQKLSKKAKSDITVGSKSIIEIDRKLILAEKGLDEWNANAAAAKLEDEKNKKNAPSIDTASNDHGNVSADLGCAVDSPEDMRHLVMSVVHENKKRAAQAQYESVSIVVSEAALHTADSSLPPELMPEMPIEDDQSNIDQYIAHWTKRTQRITGPGDALYSEPAQAPFYDEIQGNHKEMRLLVREHVRSKKHKLHNRWTDLAEEYAVREQLHEKDTKKDSNNIHSAELNGSFSICGQRRGGGAEPNSNLTNSFNSADSGSGRVSNNPYRRARRSAGFQVGGSDIVRSDYEQEQIIAQLTAQENMEKRIKLGGSDLPRQVCRLERDLSASYVDTMLSRRVDDSLEEQRKHNLTNPWSDMEKCIFFDRFLQHPKDFRKIASFLKNKNTHDCIAFYYNSKQSVPYKAALREHQMRKKRRGDVVSWEATIQAAISLGATVTAGLNSEKPLLFHLPQTDQTFSTRLLHPLKLELFDPNQSEITYEEESKEPKPRKKKSELPTTFTLDPAERKYLHVEPALDKRSGSSSDVESLSSASAWRSSSPLAVQETKNTGDQKAEVSSKKGSNKWSDKEKTAFFSALDKHGKKWETIAEAIGTKTASQTRNFYYDNKKQNEKSKGSSKETSSKVVKKGAVEEVQSVPPKQPVSNEKSLTADQIAMHLAQMNQAGGLQMPAPEHKNSTNEVLSGMIQAGRNSNLGFNQQVAWHDNNQHQLALALERHRQLSEQQRLFEHQQQFDRHRFEQLAQQHLIDQQRQQMQQQHLLDMLNQQQQNDVIGGMPSWLAAQVLHQRQQQHDMQSNHHFQNVAMAVRQLQHPQSNIHLQPNGSMQGLNSTGELDQQSELSILARMAADARSNQQNRNL